MSLNQLDLEMLPEFEEELRNTILNDVPESFPGLKEMLKYHFGWTEQTISKKTTGKQIRPIILLLSAMVCGGDWRKILPAAVSIELIHNFSLIHDDIEDQSDLRRGRDTLWKVYGIAQAINTGDAMFSLAQINMLKLGNKVNKTVGFEAAQKLNETCLLLTGGQYLDISFENNSDVSRDEYFNMIGGKTAALLAASAEIGAIAAQSSTINRLALRTYGEALGLAFQAWDDWLGIWGKQEQTGKSASTDLLSGKKTLPILFAMEKNADFSRLYQKQESRFNNFEELVYLIEQEGAKEYTEKVAGYYTDLALNSLNSINVSHKDAHETLIELTKTLILRNK
jgi:geranylgeranyl diphosphate synthase type I